MLQIINNQSIYPQIYPLKQEIASVKSSNPLNNYPIIILDKKINY